LTAPRADGAELGARLRARDVSAAAPVLNLLESRAPGAREQAAALLAAVSPAALGCEAPGHIVGITGPPGVGKSSLLSRLIAEWRGRDRSGAGAGGAGARSRAVAGARSGAVAGARASGRSVAVLAVDPTSRRSGGALLGDRARIEVDPGDRQVFVRSTAAGDRLGGLAPATRAGAAALSAAFDVVVIETVGVGQSETEVADVADTVAVVVQPASGDVLQFLKAGIMEVPDVLVVTKADLGRIAARAVTDAQAALRALAAPDTAVLAVSALAPGSGIGELADAIDKHHAALDLPARRLRARRMHALADFVAEHGERGLRALGGRREAERWLAEQDPGLDVPSLQGALERRASAA
jgi:LAO/AO transport system kinase